MTQKIEKINPTIDPSRGIDLLKKQIDKIDEIINLEYSSPKVRAWESFTGELLLNIFGKPHNNLDNFRSMLHSGGPIRIGMSDQEWQQNFVKSMENVKELLSSFVDQLELFAPVVHKEESAHRAKAIHNSKFQHNSKSSPANRKFNQHWRPIRRSPSQGRWTLKWVEKRKL